VGGVEMSEKSTWEIYKEKNKEILNDMETYRKAKPWDLLNPKTEYVEESVAKDRFDICKSCPELIKLTSQCKKCGCFMKVKTTMAHATCPIDKW
jgi:hypothetical protein